MRQNWFTDVTGVGFVFFSWPPKDQQCEDSNLSTVPEFIDPVFTKTSPKRSFSLNRKRAFWLVFAKTGSIISGTGLFLPFG
jgi:hypothetical protein